MQARASRSIEPFNAAIETLRDYVRRLLTQNKGTRQSLSPHFRGSSRGELFVA